MYESYFGLSERPFSIAPDPQYLYMSERHREAMAHLMYGVGEGGGFVQLTGEVGTGKTTLCKSLLSQIPEDVNVALLLNPRLNGHELLQVICDELGIEYQSDATPKQLHDKLNAYLLASFSEGRSTVLIVDEAQLLERDVLEQIRLLTNLETTKAKLLQIILIGQPELADLLARNDLRQLSQRITARYHLRALEPGEVADYVAYRLGVAGCKQALFSKQALTRVYRHSGGIPRLINVICDHALLAAYAKDKYIVDAAMVNAAAKEVMGPEEKSDRPRGWHWLLPAVPAVALLAVAGWMLGWWLVPGDMQDLTVQTVESMPAPAAPIVPGEPPATVVNSAATNSIVTQQKVISPSYLPPPELTEEELETDSATLGPEDDVLIAAAGAVVGEAAVPDVRLAAILEKHGADTTREAALDDLLGLWGQGLADRGDVSGCGEICIRITATGLDCLSGTGGWRQLVERDRPAMIVINDGPFTHNVVLAGLDGETALLRIGDGEFRVSVDDVLMHWTGDSLTLWQPPVPSRVFSLGASGPDVIWLRTRLNEIADFEGIEAPRLDEINPAYDQALAARVSAFQYPARSARRWRRWS